VGNGRIISTEATRWSFPRRETKYTDHQVVHEEQQMKCQPETATKLYHTNVRCEARSLLEELAPHRNFAISGEKLTWGIDAGFCENAARNRQEEKKKTIVQICFCGLQRALVFCDLLS